MNKMSWAAYAAMFTVIGALVLALAVDWKIRSDDPMDEHRCMKAEDISIRCAMRIHMLEQRIDMHEIRLEEMERMVFGTNFTKEVNND